MDSDPGRAQVVAEHTNKVFHMPPIARTRQIPPSFAVHLFNAQPVTEKP
jgi:hypothetical protein